jgi:hypothetical protein
MVIGAGSVPYPVTIRITQDAWDKADLDVQHGVSSILALNPIPLLSASGKGNGIKAESKGLEFHTQTNKRLQAPGAGPSSKTMDFDKYGKGWGH